MTEKKNNRLQIRNSTVEFNDAEILQDKGKVTAAIAIAFAESEFEQYRIIQRLPINLFYKIPPFLYCFQKF